MQRAKNESNLNKYDKSKRGEEMNDVMLRISDIKIKEKKKKQKKKNKKMEM